MNLSATCKLSFYEGKYWQKWLCQDAKFHCHENKITKKRESFWKVFSTNIKIEAQNYW